MLVTVKYFGMVVENTLTNSEVVAIEALDPTIKDLEKILQNKYPSLSNITYNIALNQQIQEKSTKINDRDELAFLPPFAGG